MSDFPLYNEPALSADNGARRDYRQLLKGNFERTELSDLFFSPKNIRSIQNAIRYQVWSRSGGRLLIAPQDETELVIGMRSTYLEFRVDCTADVTTQISDLNDRVARGVLPTIISNALQYKQYLVDKFSTPVPIGRPTCMNSAGGKQLRSVTSTF